MTCISPAQSQVTLHRYRAGTRKGPQPRLHTGFRWNIPRGAAVALPGNAASTRHPKCRVICAECCTQLKAKVPTDWPWRDSERSRKHRLLSCPLRDQAAPYGVKSTIKHCQLRVDSAAPVHYIKPCTITHASRKVKRMAKYTVWELSATIPWYNPSQHCTRLTCCRLERAKKEGKGNSTSPDIGGWWKNIWKRSVSTLACVTAWGHADRTNHACVLTAGRHPPLSNHQIENSSQQKLQVQSWFVDKYNTAGFEGEDHRRKHFQTWTMAVALEDHTGATDRWPMTDKTSSWAIQFLPPTSGLCP